MDEIHWTNEATSLAVLLSGKEVDLLTSTDSLTEHLEAQLNETITAELIESKKISGDDPILDSFNPEEGLLFAERKIWLRSQNERLVYAESIIATNDKTLLEELQSITEPIGKILTQKNIELTKSHLHIGLTSIEESEFLFNTSTPIFTKRYLLDNSDKSSYTVEILITEVFSPTLITSSKD